MKCPTWSWQGSNHFREGIAPRPSVAFEGEGKKDSVKKTEKSYAKNGQALNRVGEKKSQLEGDEKRGRTERMAKKIRPLRKGNLAGHD